MSHHNTSKNHDLTSVEPRKNARFHRGFEAIVYFLFTFSPRNIWWIIFLCIYLSSQTNESMQKTIYILLLSVLTAMASCERNSTEKMLSTDESILSVSLPLHPTRMAIIGSKIYKSRFIYFFIFLVAKILKITILLRCFYHKNWNCPPPKIVFVYINKQNPFANCPPHLCCSIEKTFVTLQPKTLYKQKIIFIWRQKFYFYYLQWAVLH